MRTSNRIAAVLLSLALFAPAAFASNQRPLALDAIRAQQAEIHAGVQARSGRYKDLSANTRNTLLEKQALVLRKIEGKISSDDLAENDRLQVFNALEWIEAALNKAEDERMVCEFRPRLGSNRKERICRTVEQIRIDHEASRNKMERGFGY